jgi:hypothetical protein
MVFDIYIDESGLFTETSTSPDDKKVEQGRGKKFPSQLAGIIVKENRLSREVAEQLLRSSCKKLNIVFGDEFHSCEIKRNSSGSFDLLVQSICQVLADTSIQPFRMVNRERVSFGDRKTNYVNIVGELLVRVCLEAHRAGNNSLTLNVFQAGVKKHEFETGDKPYWEREDFVPTLKAYFQRACISAGWATESVKWKLGSFKFLSGRRDSQMWLCDLISNASHDDYRTINNTSAVALKDLLGEYDFSLSFNTTLHQVRELCDRSAYASALIQLLEGILSQWVGSDAKTAFAREFDLVAKKMFNLPSLARTPQIQTVIGWLLQIADDRDRLDEAKTVCEWIEKRLGLGCEEKILADDSTIIPWFFLGLKTAWLTACNHSGDLSIAKEQSGAIDKLIPKIAGRWEYASDLMRSMVVQSVHLSDCFEHRKVCNKMDLVTQYYEVLGGMFREAYEDIFPTSVSSKVCGEALGTKLQSEIFLLLSGELPLDIVRETNNRAIAHFAGEDDRQRQYQIRSEIESIAGEWRLARDYLARGIGSSGWDHDSLANFIASLPAEKRRFPLLHWTRIGGLAAVAQDNSELQAFGNAWRGSNLEVFIQQEMHTYPVHGILRRVACFYAAVGNDSKVIEILRLLHTIVENNKSVLFRLIELAAVLQSAGISGRRDPALMSRILNGNKYVPAAGELLQELIEKTALSQPNITQLATEWREAIKSNLSANQLINAAKVVAY